MSYPKVYLAVDLGAGSGRVIAGIFNDAHLRLEEVSRFDNEALEIRGSIHWDAHGLYRNVCSGLGQAIRKFGSSVVSAGIDTWGVDYALLDSGGALLGLPYSYRDPRTDGVIATAEALMPQEALYARTGIQNIFFNTLYQLLAEKRARPAAMDVAERLLFIPDLLNYWLTGCMANERSIASTSQLYDPARSEWADDVISAMGLPEKIFGPLVDAGTLLGTAQINDRELNIVSVCSHDTASAILGTPLSNPHCAYISSGTWSLLGIESDSPFISSAARVQNYTNEVGYGGRVNFLKNMTGLWIAQECKRAWESDGNRYGYDQLVSEAEAAPPFAAFLDPDAPDFVAPGHMPRRLTTYLSEHGQPAPELRGDLLRIVYENMALQYRKYVTGLEAVTGREIGQIHLVGGGSRNELLNQFAANALNRPVIAGPVEATAVGNIVAQMLADESMGSVDEARQMICDSFDEKLFLPFDKFRWEDAAQRRASFFGI